MSRSLVFGRVLLVAALAALGYTAFLAVGSIHHGGGWSTERCVSAQDEGASHDLLIEHNCEINPFDNLVHGVGGSLTTATTGVPMSQCYAWQIDVDRHDAEAVQSAAAMRRNGCPNG